MHHKKGDVVCIVDNLGQKLEVKIVQRAVLGSVYFKDPDGEVQKVSLKDWKELRHRAKVLGYK